MQIAAVTPTRTAQVPNARLASREVPPAPYPAAGLYRSRGMDILDLPGMHSLSFSMLRPDVLELNVYTEQDAALLAMYIEPVIDGVKLELHVGVDREPYTGTPSGSVADMLRGIAGLPGVWNVDQRGITMTGGTARVQTINQATIDRLDPLVKDQLDFGKRPGTNIQRWVNVRWVPGIPG